MELWKFLSVPMLSLFLLSASQKNASAEDKNIFLPLLWKETNTVQIVSYNQKETEKTDIYSFLLYSISPLPSYLSGFLNKFVYKADYRMIIGAEARAVINIRQYYDFFESIGKDIVSADELEKSIDDLESKIESGEIMNEIPRAKIDEFMTMDPLINEGEYRLNFSIQVPFR